MEILLMIKTLSVYDFIEEFESSSRKNQFSREALKAIYYFYEDCAPTFELDIIGICCEWTEYTDYDLMVDYGYLGEFEDIDQLIEELQTRTIVLDAGDGKLVVENF